jgi:uncharacterized protein YbjT (DUF2867 family)
VQNILIIGGTGKTGRRICRRLREAGIPVRAASRTGGDVGFDLGDPDTWAPALKGVTAAYLVEPDLHAAAMTPMARIPRLVSAAVAAGTRRLVLLSAPLAEHEGHPLHSAEHAVRSSGVEWTLLRPGWFAQNFSESFWRAGVLAGSLALPTGNGRTPFVDAEDIAEVAIAALAHDGHHGRAYALTGPRAISFGEALNLISRATGRPIRHHDVDPDVYIEQQVTQGVPRDVARILTGVFTAIRDGRDTATADGVQRALGRPARPFEEYAAAAAAAGAWH